jgi:hypothetical protein
VDELIDVEASQLGGSAISLPAPTIHSDRHRSDDVTELRFTAQLLFRVTAHITKNVSDYLRRVSSDPANEDIGALSEVSLRRPYEVANYADPWGLQLIPCLPTHKHSRTLIANY